MEVVAGAAELVGIPTCLWGGEGGVRPGQRATKECILRILSFSFNNEAS